MAPPISYVGLDLILTLKALGKIVDGRAGYRPILIFFFFFFFLFSEKIRLGTPCNGVNRVQDRRLT